MASKVAPEAKAATAGLSEEVILRVVALSLAVWSHGPQAGHQHDDCFPARAKRFLKYLLAGE